MVHLSASHSLIFSATMTKSQIFEIYDLTDHDKAMVLAKEGESIGGLPVDPEAQEDYLSETEATKEFPLDNIREFIKSLPIKEFTQEERETIEKEFPSLYQKTTIWKSSVSAIKSTPSMSGTGSNKARSSLNNG